MTPIIIGIHGRARSGKDTMAGLLVERGFHRMAFADPLKKAAAHLLDLPEDYVFDDANKTVYLDDWGFTLRDFLQRLGTEAMRNVFRDDFWIRRWRIGAAKLIEPIVVADVRFENEAAAIREMGGVIVHLHRDGAGLTGTEAAHVSEAGIACQPTDFTIHNNSTIYDLETAVIALLDDLGFY